MSLAYILKTLDAEAGFHSDGNNDDLVYLTARCNSIAKDLYDKDDLVGSLLELIAFWDEDSKLVSLPSYVGEVRGVRYYDSPVQVTLRDIRPRYATETYGVELRDFREIGNSSMFIQMDNYTELTFSLPEGEVAEKDIEITIVGRTDVSSKIQEVVTISEGENSATSINTWEGAPTVIKKLEACNFDILVTDADETELALIPNNQLASEYQIWQVRDDKMVGQMSSNSLEILYKQRFEPFVNTGDEFLVGKYDDVIVWKFLEEFWSKQDGKESLVANAQLMWASKLSSVNGTKDKGKKVETQHVSNKFYSLFDRANWKALKYP